MMLHIIVDGADGKPRGAGATYVEAMPNVADIVTLETATATIRLEVIETHHTLQRVSMHFSDEADWAYCRRIEIPE